MAETAVSGLPMAESTYLDSNTGNKEAEGDIMEARRVKPQLKC